VLVGFSEHLEFEIIGVSGQIIYTCQSVVQMLQLVNDDDDDDDARLVVARVSVLVRSLTLFSCQSSHIAS